MGSCIIVAAVISCTGFTAERPTPQQAIDVLLSGPAPRVVVAVPRAAAPAARATYDPHWPFRGAIRDQAPTRPLSPDGPVTVYLPPYVSPFLSLGGVRYVDTARLPAPRARADTRRPPDRRSR